jgi:hypothetical protein
MIKSKAADFVASFYEHGWFVVVCDVEAARELG